MCVVQVKCEVYWPRGEVGSSVVHGAVEVTLLAITVLADYTIRTIQLHKVRVWSGVWSSKVTVVNGMWHYRCGGLRCEVVGHIYPLGELVGLKQIRC